MHRSDGIHGTDTSSSSDSLPALVGRLGEDLSRLVDTKLSLLKIEIQDDLHSYLRGAVQVVAAGAAAAVGFGLVSVGVALFGATLLAQSASLSWPTAQVTAFVVIGFLFMGGGVIVARLAIARLKYTDATPERSIRELERDREWLRAEK
jgi:uncharacterized membrane protein YqjE